MRIVFLSYSIRDYFFAEMLAIKLEEVGFKIWRDMGSIRAGDDWRHCIEEGIKDCFAVVVALSETSAESAYVTYEWAYAIGMGRPVIPVKLSECKVHPRLEPTQYVDFSYPRALPWASLIDRLKEVEVEQASTSDDQMTHVLSTEEYRELDEVAGQILGYLNSRGFTMVSFERLQEKIRPSIPVKILEKVIENKPDIFRRAQLKGGKPGVAKRVP